MGLQCCVEGHRFQPHPTLYVFSNIYFALYELTLKFYLLVICKGQQLMHRQNKKTRLAIIITIKSIREQVHNVKSKFNQSILDKNTKTCIKGFDILIIQAYIKEDTWLLLLQLYFNLIRLLTTLKICHSLNLSPSFF